MNHAATSTVSALALIAQLVGVKPDDPAFAEQLKAALGETLVPRVPDAAALVEPIRTALAETLLAGPSELQGLPPSILLQRVVPVAIASELLGVTPETVLKNYRDKLIKIDGRRYGMRLYDALRLEPPHKPRNRASLKRASKRTTTAMAEAP